MSKTTWDREQPDFMGRASGLIERPSDSRPQRAAAALGPARGLARILPEGIRRRFVEAMGGGSLLGQWSGGGNDEDLSGYRPLGQRIDAITRDLDSWMYDRQIRMALYLYATNPMAEWLVDNLVDLTLGQEVNFTFAIDPEKAGLIEDKADAVMADAGKYLRAFWTHPAHDLRFRAREYAVTQLVTGALLLPATVNDVDGLPMLDLIDAQQIAKVESADRSAIVPGAVHYRGAGQVGDTKPLEVIRQREREGPLEGEAFYFPLRKLLNQLMGTSYLLSAIDWLDRHDQFLFNALDRGKLANAFAWVVKMEGFNATQCEEHAAKLKKQGAFNGPGGVVVTNEKGDLDAVSPDLQSGDVDVMARVFRTHILGSKSRPESWYASGGDTNRATAGEQTDVAYKSLERWQSHFRGIFETILAFAYDSGIRAQAEVRRQWPARSTGAVTLTVNLPPVRERDFARTGQALESMANGLELGIEGELISRKTSRAVYLTAAGKLGAEVDPAKEDERIDAEEEERDQVAEANAAMKAAIAGKVSGIARDDEVDPEAMQGKKRPAAAKGGSAA